MVKRFMRTTKPKLRGIRREQKEHRREVNPAGQRTDEIKGSGVGEGASGNRRERRGEPGRSNLDGKQAGERR